MYTPDKLNDHIGKLATALVTAVIVVSCATTGRHDASSVSEPPPGRAGDQVEEIIVTAQKAATGPVYTMGGTGAMSVGMARLRAPHDEALASVQPGEEVWIIARPAASAGITDNDDSQPGSGAMVASFPDDVDPATGEPKQIPLPLQHTDVKAHISGYISTVNVIQSFANPFSEKIEAVYLFPLPEKSAVSEFVMIIGERKIRGILREKEEAEEIYRQARDQGYQASLLTQHRPNIFEQKVANIEPGKSIDIDIRYIHTLAYNDGWYSFVFPTVVGPRFNPPGHTDGIGAAARNGEAQQDVSVQYLRPDERSAHDIRISVDINPGVAIEELRATHNIASARPSPESAVVVLAEETTMPNKDFVLRFRVAGKTIKSGLLTYVDPNTQQGYFTMMMYPPENPDALARKALELVFVLDCSGSMSGVPLRQSKDAVLSALSHLQPDDTFQIIRFSDNASQFGSAPVPASRENVALARTYLKSLSGSGGTMMIEGIQAALDFPHDPSRLRFVTFLTDGYIGNETQIIGEVNRHIGESRIFSFGVGSSVNRFLLERMAKEGRGAVAYLGPQDSGATIMADFFDRISHPALTDVAFDWGTMSVSDVYPSRIPDLFVGRPLVVTGKFLGAPGEVVASGSYGRERQDIVISEERHGEANEAISRIWARLRIADLADQSTWQDDPHGELENAIRHTALQYGLVSDYTSFVAVDASRLTDGDHGVTVHQAVPVPEGVLYETTVNEN